MAESTPSNILIVDDSLINLNLLGQVLIGQGYQVLPVNNGRDAIAAAIAAPPDLILLDVRMPDMDGYQVCQQLKADERTRSIPIIFLSGLGDTEDKLKAFQVGGVDYVTKPFHPEEVLARVRTHLALEKARSQLESTNRELKDALTREELLARTDWLTGVLNRSHFFSLGLHEFMNSVRYDRPISILMFDIDHFKQVNDQFGHPTGDLVLRRIAQTAAGQIRSSDVIGRYGGEEFIILFPMTNVGQALAMVERIRREIDLLRVETDKGVVKVTISLGLTERLLEGDSLESMINRADQAMYAAKRGGRNRLVCM